MLDEKIMYGNETVAERVSKAKMYWGWIIYQDLMKLNNRLHEAKKLLSGDELGILAELDTQILMDQAAEMAEINWKEMPNMDHHYKVIGNPRAS